VAQPSQTRQGRSFLRLLLLLLLFAPKSGRFGGQQQLSAHPQTDI
jgi:hypothetical protein